MPAPPTSDETLRQSLELFQSCGSVVAAAKQAGIPYTTMQSRLRMARARREELEPPVPSTHKHFEDAWRVWMDHIGAVKDRYKGPAKPRGKNARTRIVAAGDFHVPFHDQEAVAELIAKEAKQADVLLIGGDFGDAYAASVYTKYQSVAFEYEHAQKTVVLQALSEAFPEIIWLKGSNHSDRYEKRLRENLSRDLLSAVMEMTGGILNPELALARRFPNVKVQCWKTPEGHEVPWLAIYGNVAFSHAEKYSRVPLAALRAVEEWLDDFSGHLGLPEIKAVMQFHTHTMSLAPWRSDMLLVEPGAMCLMQDYQLGSKIGGRPQRCGYVSMEFEDGLLDVSSVRLHWLK
jgi:hypothetical protein